MKKRIFRTTSVLIILTVLLTAGVMSFIIYRNNFREMELSVKTECAYIKSAIQERGQDYLDENIANITASRVTWVDGDGDIRFDSAAGGEKLENHAGRPEIAAAFQKGRGSAVRFSDTLRRQTYYYAVRMTDGSVIRVARTTDTVLKSLESAYLAAIILICVLGVLALFTSSRTTRRIMDPLRRLDLDHPADNRVYEEFAPLLLRIEKQGSRIKKQVKELRRAQEEYLAITEHMKDGLIVTGKHKVLSINRAAQGIFGITKEACIGRDIITISRNEELRSAFLRAVAGEADERVVTIAASTYHISATPVFTKRDKVAGSVLMIVDETERQKAEQVRKEFTANVSHELKTPLMSISGYAELIEQGVAKKEDITVFAGRIHAEAKRLSALVGDIIKLSALDEIGDDPHADGEQAALDVDLYALSEEIVAQLSFAADQAGVLLTLSGEKLSVPGMRDVLADMIYNLADNAIKYNRPGGKVRITTETDEEGRRVLRVSDDGIGIAASEQERIFERFYRVDKSRSRKTGGTGLGLSIVKHAALAHHAKVELASEPGKGTKISIIFDPPDTGHEV